MALVVDGQQVPERTETEARRTIRLALRYARYRTTLTGEPVDDHVRDAIGLALEEQARALMHRDTVNAAVQDAAALSPLGRPLQSATIGGVSYTVDTSASTIPAGYRLDGDGMARAALDVLNDAGILGGGVYAYG